MANASSRAQEWVRQIFTSTDKWKRWDALRHPFRATVFCMVMVLVPVQLLTRLVDHYFNLSILSPTENNDGNYDPFDLIQSTQQVIDGPIDTNIVIIDIGNIDRGGIAMVANTILEFEPAVVGVDIDLAAPKSAMDTTGTAALLGTMEHDDRVIMGYILQDMDHVDTLRMQQPGQWGYTNLDIIDGLSTVRYFTPRRNGKADDRNPDYHFSFAAQVVKRYGPDRWSAYSEELSEDDQTELIHFVRTDDPGDAFKKLKLEDVQKGDSIHARAALEGKIVILADQGTCPVSDLHYTPLNPVLSGHSAPDMQGAELHARWVSNILNGRRLEELSWLSTFMALFFMEFMLCSLLLLMVPKTITTGQQRLWVAMGLPLAKVVMLVVVSGLIYLVASQLFRAGYALPIGFLVIATWLTSGFVDAYCTLFRPN